MNELLERLVRGSDLSETEAAELLVAMTDEAFPPATAGALLTALRCKGETAAEVRGFASGMRRLAIRPDIPEDTPGVDVVGTGGDHSGSLNLSTGSALLTAACGPPVMKHGNRSISSRSGSADVLQALGVTLPVDAASAGAHLAATGFTFLFAPSFHPAMKAIAPVRRTLGIRTIFNILGPLCNPAQPPFYVIGAFDPDVAALMADALSGLAIQRAFVVHGAASWDEATPVGPFLLFDVTPGSVTMTERDPAKFGIPPCTTTDLQGGDAAENAAAIRAVFAGERGAHRDALVLGTGLALEVTGTASSLEEGIARAGAALDDGSAAALLDRLREVSSTPEAADG